MKKRKLLSVLLGSICALSLLTGCRFIGGNKNSADESSSSVSDNSESSSSSVPVEGEEVLLAGFETYEEMLTYHYTNYFGAAKPSKEYVTQGKGGAAITVNGRYANTQRPAIVIDTNTEYLEKSDYTDVSEIKLDVRNDNNYAANIYFQYGSLTETGLKLSSAMKQTLEAGFEGTVTFSIDRNLASEFLNLDYVTEIRLVFDSPKEAIPTLGSTEDALANYRKFHIDNLRAVLTAKEIEKTPVRKDAEIESGDKEEYLAAWYLPSGYRWSPSSVSFNDDADYIKGGNGSLKFKLEGSARDAGKKTTAYWAMSVNQNPDISNCYAVGFWMYNSETTQPINLYSHAPLSNTEKFVQRLAYGWNYIELTVNDLRDKYGYDEKNFLFGMVLQFIGGADYDIYLDEMYALPYTTPEIKLPAGENVGNIYYAAYEVGETVTVPQATTLHAGSESVTVIGPDGKEVSLQDNKFTASTKGEYTVTYKATATHENTDGEKETVEKSIFIAVGELPTFNNTNRLTDVFGQATGTWYTIPEVALSKDQISWQVELYGGRFNGAGKAGEPYDYSHTVNGYEHGVRKGNPTSFYLMRGIDHRIVYTATSSDGLRAQFIQHVYADEATILLSDKYENFYDSTRVGGDLTVNEAGDGFVLKTEGTKATGLYTNSIKVGYQAKFLRFMVYNAGDTKVTFKINNGMEFTIAAKGYALFNPDSFGYQAAVVGWKMASADSKLLPLTFTATSATTGIELYLSRFGVNEDAFGDPTLEAPVFEEYYEEGTTVTIGKPAVVGLSSYSYKVTAPDGSVVLFDVSTANASMAIVVLQTGMYTVEYSTTYEDYDGSAKDLVATATFKVLSDKPVFLTETNKIVDLKDVEGTAYMLTEADKPNLSLADGSTATLTSWKVYKFHRDNVNRLVADSYASNDEIFETEALESELVIEDGVLVGIKATKNYSYRIEYKVEAYGELFTVDKGLFFTNSTRLMNITEEYEDFYTAGEASGSVTTSAEKGIVLSGAGGVTNLNGNYVNPVSLGNLTSMTLVFYNAGDADVFIYFYGAPVNMPVRVAVKAHQYAGLEFGVATLKSWGFVAETEDGYVFGGDAGNNNYRFSMKVYNPTNKVNVSLCGIWFNASAFLPELDGAEYESEYGVDTELTIAAPQVLVNITEYNVTLTKAGETVYTCTQAEVEAGTATFTLTETGEYTVTYTGKYTLKGEEMTYERSYTFKVLAAKPVFLTETNKIVDLKGVTDTTYTLTDADKPNLSLADGSTATLVGWKVYKFHRDYVNRLDASKYQIADEIYETEVLESELVIEEGVLVGIKAAKNYSYRIVYTVNAYEEELTAVKTLFFTDSTNKANITEVYEDFYTAGEASGSVTSSTETGIVLSGFGGVSELSGMYVNPVSLGNLTNMTLVFYNAGADDLFLMFHGAPDTSAVRIALKSQQYTCLEFNVTTLKAWGFVTETENGYVFGGAGSNTNRVALKVYSPTNKVNVSLCGIWFNASAFLPELDGVTYESEYFTGSEIAIVAPEVLVNITDYTVTVKKAGETVYTCEKADVEAETAVFTATEAGEYTVTYTGKYTLNGEEKTYEKSYTFTCKTDVNDSTGEGLVTDNWTDLEQMY